MLARVRTLTQKLKRFQGVKNSQSPRITQYDNPNAFHRLHLTYLKPREDLFYMAWGFRHFDVMILKTMTIALFLFSSLSITANASDQVTGNWTYRSFHNDPNLTDGDSTKLSELLFGEGTMKLDMTANQKISGTLDFGPDYILDISGTLQNGTGDLPDVIKITATGRKGTHTAGWIYAYQAYPTVTWPNGVNQRASFVGSAIRVVPHDGGAAGVTVSFIAVKQN